MTENITIRAKSNGKEITGELVGEGGIYWRLRLAPKTTPNSFPKYEWDRVYTLPTKPGTVFRATVRGVPNVRVMVVAGSREGFDYISALLAGLDQWHADIDIDSSTVVPELEAD